MRSRFNQHGEVSQGRNKSSFTDHTGKTRVVKYVEIINGVDYIIFLEYGYSGQAPHGMVRVSMRELRKGKLPQDMSKRFQKSWNEIK